MERHVLKEDWEKGRKGRRQNSNMTSQNNKKADRKMESNDSPAILDRGEGDLKRSASLRAMEEEEEEEEDRQTDRQAGRQTDRQRIGS